MNALGLSCIVLAIVCVRLGYGLYTAPACNHTHFPTDIPPNETHVELNNCPFSEIYPGEMAYLYAITDFGFFSNPRIVNFPNLTDIAGTLINLRIADCSVTYIPPELLRPLVNLQKLGVQRNQVINIPILPELTQMGFLPCRLNRLTEYPVLTAWPLLQFVDLSENPISSVDPDSFAGLKQLLTVKLEYLNFTELPRFDAPQSQFTKLYLTGSSIALMPAQTTAVLGTLTLLKAANTAQLEFLPTLCTRDPPSLSIDVTGSGLKLCDCRHAWLKAVVEAGATITVHPTVCWGEDWASMTTAHFLTHCHHRSQEANMTMQVFNGRKKFPVYCAFPRGVIHTDVALFRCFTLCATTKGCLSVNFRSTRDGGVGECVLLAPTLDGIYEQAADQEGWTLYGLMFGDML